MNRNTGIDIPSYRYHHEEVCIGDFDYEGSANSISSASSPDICTNELDDDESIDSMATLLSTREYYYKYNDCQEINEDLHEDGSVCSDNAVWSPEEESNDFYYDEERDLVNSKFESTKNKFLPEIETQVMDGTKRYLNHKHQYYFDDCCHDEYPSHHLGKQECIPPRPMLSRLTSSDTAETSPLYTSDDEESSCTFYVDEHAPIGECDTFSFCKSNNLYNVANRNHSLIDDVSRSYGNALSKYQDNYERIDHMLDREYPSKENEKRVYSGIQRIRIHRNDQEEYTEKYLITKGPEDDENSTATTITRGNLGHAELQQKQIVPLVA